MHGPSSITERKLLDYCKTMIEINLTFSIKLDSLFTSCVSFCRFASTVSCPAGEMPKKRGQKSERQEILKVYKAVKTNKCPTLKKNAEKNHLGSKAKLKGIAMLQYQTLNKKTKISTEKNHNPSDTQLALVISKSTTFLISS